MKQAVKKPSKLRRSRTVDRNRLILTPKIYRKLDLIARKEGYVLQVTTQEELDEDRCWARTGGFAQGVYRDLTGTTVGSGLFETTLIEIAPSIPLQNFSSARRPELDYSHVPKDKIWEFVLQHEIGHLKGMYCPIDLHSACAPEQRKEWARGMWAVNESLADRYAWNALFSDAAPPISDNRMFTAEYIETWQRVIPQKIKFRSLKREALATEPYRNVPYRHVKKGIPFENTAHRKSALDELIAYRRVALPGLLKAAKDSGVIVEYLHGNEGEVPTPSLALCPELAAKVMTLHRLKSELEMFDGYAKEAITAALPRVPPSRFTSSSA